MALDEHVHHFSTDEYSRIVGTGALDGIRVELLDGLLVDMNRHPETALLVAEVAVSSKQVDLRKAAVYAAAGIPIYWLVDVLARTVL